MLANWYCRHYFPIPRIGGGGERGGVAGRSVSEQGPGIGMFRRGGGRAFTVDFERRSH